jgi:hypothetical protein
MHLPFSLSGWPKTDKETWYSKLHNIIQEQKTLLNITPVFPQRLLPLEITGCRYYLLAAVNPNQLSAKNM